MIDSFNLIDIGIDIRMQGNIHDTRHINHQYSVDWTTSLCRII